MFGYGRRGASSQCYVANEIIALPELYTRAVASPYPASCLIKSGDALFLSILLVAAMALTSVPVCEPERVLKSGYELVRF